MIEKYWGGCVHKGLWPTWRRGESMNEWMNWADFSCWCKFRKVKNYFNNFWVTVVKNGLETLISMNGILLNFCMLVHINESWKLLNSCWVGKVKYGCVLLSHRTHTCMLIHGVRKTKSYFGYAEGQIWLWLFRSWDSKICFISTQK